MPSQGSLAEALIAIGIDVSKRVHHFPESVRLFLVVVRVRLDGGGFEKSLTQDPVSDWKVAVLRKV